MEDLAYLYLALNEEVERAQRGFDAFSANLPTTWMAPPQNNRTIVPEYASDRPPSASTMQSPDLDLDSPIYPSFYL